jgi:hypothetical protein
MTLCGKPVVELINSARNVPDNCATGGSSKTRFRRGLRVSSPDDRTTLCGECETFRFAIQIAEPPCIKERNRAAADLKMIEPCNRGGLVTE